MRLSRLTIRARITVGSLIIAVVISIIAGVVIYNQVERIVTGGRISVLESVEAPYLTAVADSSTEDLDPPGPGQLIAVVNPAGVAEIDTLPAELSSMIPALVEHAGETKTVSTATQSYLVRVTDVPTDSGTWIVITADGDDVADSVLNQMAILLILAIAGINIGFALASWLIGSAALRPVGQLRRSAGELVSHQSDELLPVGPASDEISNLARTLNELIRQLRTSAERERQIVSDASHEFRTPLAILQTQLELAQAEATSIDQLQADVGAARKTLARLSALATSMLELSRIDAQADPGSATGTELDAELADAADRARHQVGGRDIRIEFSGDLEPAVRVRVGVRDFGRVCDNLLHNSLAALKQPGTIVMTLELSDNGEAAILRVLDDAGGMDPAFVPHALDRFSRSDSARTSAGAGLGLSIVAGIASLSGGSVVLENRPGEGLDVLVSFPLESEPGDVEQG